MMNNGMDDAESGLVSYQSSHTNTLSESASPEVSSNSGSAYSSSPSSSAATSTTSILHPILIRDARTRSYLVGSIGSHVK